MKNIEKHLAFVKAQASYHQSRSASQRTSEFARKKHAEAAAGLLALAADLESASEQPGPPANQASSQDGPSQRTGQRRLALTPADIRGLPPELLGELSVAGDLAEFTILDLIQEHGGIASLDQLLVGLYRKTGEVHKRQTVISRLYRMGQKDLVHNVPGKKGAYSTEPLSELQVAKLFGELPAAPLLDQTP